MRYITAAGLDFIKSWEGFSDTVYLDIVGYPTIGYGHVVRPGEDFGTITVTEAESLLLRDLSSAERAVLRLTHVPLTNGQFDALVSFVFNLGSGAYQRSTLRAKVNRGEHEDVPDEFLKWVWAGGKKIQGLMRRRQGEASLYATDDCGSGSDLGGSSVVGSE